MTKNNMELWDSVFITDPNEVKPITGKQYKGNSPKPYWIIRRATETFGACGIGWGITVINERFERFGDDGDSLHVALVEVWYKYKGEVGKIQQFGQTKASYTSSAGKFILDEDAPKKSMTDGVIKCLSYLGFAGDIFSGRWDDSGYVQYAAEETRKREEPKISDTQLADLMALSTELDIDLAAFCKRIKVDTLRDLLAADYDKAVALMETKRKKD